MGDKGKSKEITRKNLEGMVDVLSSIQSGTSMKTKKFVRMLESAGFYTSRSSKGHNIILTPEGNYLTNHDGKPIFLPNTSKGEPTRHIYQRVKQHIENNYMSKIDELNSNNY